MNGEDPEKDINPQSDLFIRHGQFEQLSNLPLYQQFQEFLSNPNAFPLSKKGIEEMRQATERLPLNNIGLIVSSPYLRAKQSAQVLQEEIERRVHKEIPIRVTTLAREIDIPPDILSEKEFHNALKQGGVESVADEVFGKWTQGGHGESPEDVKKRIGNLLRYIRRIHRWTRYDNVAILSHASFGRALKRFTEGRALVLPRTEDKELRMAEGYHLVRNPSMLTSYLESIQPGEFTVLPLETTHS